MKIFPNFLKNKNVAAPGNLHFYEKSSYSKRNNLFPKGFNNYGEENRYKRYVFVVLSPCYGKIEACYILENSVAKIKTKRTNTCLRNVSYWFLKNSLSTLNIDKIWICLSCKNNGTSNLEIMDLLLKYEFLRYTRTFPLSSYTSYSSS